MRFRFLGAAFMLAPLLCGTGCNSNSTTTQHPVVRFTPIPVSEAIRHSRPIDLYVGAYGAFQFSSKSKLSLGTGDTAKTFEGRTFLEHDEFGNYHLIRVPLSSENTLDLLSLHRNVYLRTGKEVEFREVRHQTEFDRWAARALREVLNLYEPLGIETKSAPSKKGELTCWTDRAAQLCTDSVTGLPLEGYIRTTEKDGSALEVRFSLLPARERSLTISPPERIRK